MDLEERKAVAEAWAMHSDEKFKVIIHVGSTSYKQSQILASHAMNIHADAIGCMGPVFLPPNNINNLVDFCAKVASAAPELPFYYYHIPVVSGVHVSMPGFLRAANEKIPNLAGLKFTDFNLMQMFQCMRLYDGKFDILHGYDEVLLAGLTLGAQGAVGSTYNYMAPVYSKVIQAFQSGDLETARDMQERAVNFVDILIRYGGGVIAGKPVMKMVGLDCGPLRSPVKTLKDKELLSYEKELKAIGFFDWLK